MGLGTINIGRVWPKTRIGKCQCNLLMVPVCWLSEPKVCVGKDGGDTFSVGYKKTTNSSYWKYFYQRTRVHDLWPVPQVSRDCGWLRTSDCPGNTRNIPVCRVGEVPLVLYVGTSRVYVLRLAKGYSVTFTTFYLGVESREPRVCVHRKDDPCGISPELNYLHDVGFPTVK